MSIRLGNMLIPGKATGEYPKAQYFVKALTTKQ